MIVVVVVEVVEVVEVVVVVEVTVIHHSFCAVVVVVVVLVVVVAAAASARRPSESRCRMPRKDMGMYNLHQALLFCSLLLSLSRLQKIPWEAVDSHPGPRVLEYLPVGPSRCGSAWDYQSSR